jgi:hypothetical protein
MLPRHVERKFIAVQKKDAEPRHVERKFIAVQKKTPNQDIIEDLESSRHKLSLQSTFMIDNPPSRDKPGRTLDTRMDIDKLLTDRIRDMTAAIRFLRQIENTDRKRKHS